MDEQPTGPGQVRRAYRLDTFVAGDPIRGLAAILVFIFHTALAAAVAIPGSGANILPNNVTDLGGAFYPYKEIVENLFVLVYIFFVLSGYLLFRPFVRWLTYDARRPALGDYWRNRALRIVPAFWIAIAIAWLLEGWGDSSAWQIISVPLLLHVYDPSPASDLATSHTWTVDVEAGFYLLLPLIAFGIARFVRAGGEPGQRVRRLMLAMGGLFVVAIAMRSAFPDTREWQRAPLGVMWCFVPGMALASIEPAAMTWLRARAPLAGRIAFWLGILALLCVAAQSRMQPFATGRRALVLAVGAAAFVGAALVLQWAGQRPWRWLDNRVFRFYGEISYSFYLFHFIVLTELATLFSHTSEEWGFVRAGVPAFAITTVAGYLGYRFVELPAMNRKRRSVAAPDAHEIAKPSLAHGHRSAETAP